MLDFFAPKAQPKRPSEDGAAEAAAGPSSSKKHQAAPPSQASGSLASLAAAAGGRAKAAAPPAQPASVAATAVAGGLKSAAYSLSTAEVQSLVDLGFSASQAEQALKVTQGNAERAANWLFGQGS